MKTIKEIKQETGNNTSVIAKGVYQELDGTFTWVTYTRSGNCKRVSTAMKKAGFTV